MMNLFPDLHHLVLHSLGRFGGRCCSHKQHHRPPNLLYIVRQFLCSRYNRGWNIAISVSSNVENVSPHVIKQVAKELTQLSGEPPEGIKVFLNDEDVTDIQAAIDGPAGTPYAGGLFRMKLVLTKNFPHEPPKAFFLTKIFHPNVASNGEICVNTLKKDWKPELGIRHILLTVKCLLIVPNPESALNEEAGKLLLEQYDDYSLRAKLYTDIHAKHPVDSQGSSTSDGPLAKKHAGDKKLLDKKKKEKKKVLKRL